MKKLLKQLINRFPYRAQKSLYTGWFYLRNIHKMFENPIGADRLAVPSATKNIRLIGFLKVRDEVASGNLERALRHMSRFCDGIVACDCGSTDNSAEIMKRYTTHILHEPNDFKRELFTKQKMLDCALKLNADWIVWLDADEVFDRDGESGGIRNLCLWGDKNKIDGFSFLEYNLWKSDREYRVDELFGQGWFVRLWKNNGHLHFDLREGLHRPQHPLGMEHIKRTSIKVIHYGFASQKRIDEKYERYKKNGQKGYMGLERLRYEKGMKLKTLDSNCFPLSLNEQ